MMAQDPGGMIAFGLRCIRHQPVGDFGELAAFLMRMYGPHDEQIRQHTQEQWPGATSLTQAAGGKVMEVVGGWILGERTHRGHTRKLLSD